VSFYVVLIPLFIGDIDLGGEKSNLEFLAIPIMVIISTAFLTINKLANLFGDLSLRTKSPLFLLMISVGQLSRIATKSMKSYDSIKV
jgi:hypothetical protein